MYVVSTKRDRLVMLAVIESAPPVFFHLIKTFILPLCFYRYFIPLLSWRSGYQEVGYRFLVFILRLKVFLNHAHPSLFRPSSLKPCLALHATLPNHATHCSVYRLGPLAVDRGTRHEMVGETAHDVQERSAVTVRARRSRVTGGGKP